jgi:transposase
MGRAVAVRSDYTAGEVRRFAKRAKDAAQARRLLAIAAVLDGASRTEAARIGGMDRQTLRDWVIRFNDQGADGLINIPSPGLPPKLNTMHRAFLVRIVEEGPIPAIHGVVRWRACDLIMRLCEEFRLSVSDDTIYRALKDLGVSHVSARRKAYKQDPRPWRRSKNFRRPWWRSRRDEAAWLRCCRPEGRGQHRSRARGRPPRTNRSIGCVGRLWRAVASPCGPSDRSACSSARRASRLIPRTPQGRSLLRLKFIGF